MRLLGLFIMATALRAQTALPGPVQVLPKADQSKAFAMEMLDLHRHYVGFIAPDTVTQITVSSATAANPMVLTLANPRPPSIVSGGTVTITGALGTGCAGMNATQPVSAVGASTITITFNGTGCTYTASSAKIGTEFWWELPPADGTSGTCLGWSAAYVLGWEACSGGGGANQALSNLTNPTAINQDLLPGVNDTSRLGTDTGPLRWYELNANRLNGICSGCLAADNYLRTRTIFQFDQLGASLYWSQDVNAGGATSSWSISDESGNAVLSLYRIFAGIPEDVAEFDVKLMPTTGGTRDIGASGKRWATVYPTDLDVSGTTTLGAITGATQCLQVNSSGVVSGTGSGCNGTGSSLPVIDSTDIFYQSGDPSAIGKFSATNISTGTTRTFAFQDASYTVAGLEQAQTFTATNIMRDVFPSLDDTYRLGETDGGTGCSGVPCRWYEVNANRFNGVKVGQTSDDNYVLTREVRFVDANGGTASWNVRSSVPSGLLVSEWELFDSTDTDTVRFARVLFGVVVDTAEFDLSVLPFSDNRRTNGAIGRRWSGLFSVNGDFSGTLTLGSLTGTLKASAGAVSVVTGTGTDCVLVNGTSAACGGGGANTALSNLAATAVNTDIIPAGNNTTNFGDGGHYWHTAYLNNIFSSSQLITLGTSSGTTYPFRVTDTGGSPGINFYSATSTKSGSLSSGATAAMTIQDSTDLRRAVFYQDGGIVFGGGTGTSPGPTTVRFEHDITYFGWGAAASSIRLDRSLSSNATFVEFTVAGNAATTGSWLDGVIANGFSLLYGAAFTEYIRTEATGLTRLTGTSSGTTYTLGVRDTGGSPGINFFSSTSTKAASVSAGATAAFSIQDSGDIRRSTWFQTGGIIFGGGSSSPGATTARFEHTTVDVGWGGNSAILRIDRSSSTNAAQIQFPVAGNASTVGSWTLGTNLNTFNMFYGASVAEYMRTDSGGLTRFTGTTSGITYTLGVRDTGGSPGINFFRNTSTLSGSISSGATAAFGFADSGNVNRLLIFQSGDVQVNSTSDQGFSFYVSGTTKLSSSLTVAGLSGGGTRCTQVDNNGLFSGVTGGCVTTSGTATMSGNYSITGNFFSRSFSGSGISCAAVADGWMGWDTAGQYLIMCASGSRYRVNLVAY